MAHQTDIRSSLEADGFHVVLEESKPPTTPEPAEKSLVELAQELAELAELRTKLEHEEQELSSKLQVVTARLEQVDGEMLRVRKALAPTSEETRRRRPTTAAASRSGGAPRKRGRSAAIVREALSKAAPGQWLSIRQIFELSTAAKEGYTLAAVASALLKTTRQKITESRKATPADGIKSHGGRASNLYRLKQG